jgi:hypothetical protein
MIKKKKLERAACDYRILGMLRLIKLMKHRGLLKPAGYNSYPCTRARYPCPGIGGYTGTGLRRPVSFFLEKTRCTRTRLPAARCTRTRLLKRYNVS